MNLLSCTKDMNSFHSCYESLYKRKVRGVKLLSIFLFFLLIQSTLFVYKSLIIVIENSQKYNWIQHKKTQPVFVTKERNKLL